MLWVGPGNPRGSVVVSWRPQLVRARAANAACVAQGALELQSVAQIRETRWSVFGDVRGVTLRVRFLNAGETPEVWRLDVLSKVKI